MSQSNVCVCGGGMYSQYVDKLCMSLICVSLMCVCVCGGVCIVSMLINCACN